MGGVQAEDICRLEGLHRLHHMKAILCFAPYRVVACHLALEASDPAGRIAPVGRYFLSR